jgi:hypothetical protein
MRLLAASCLIALVIPVSGAPQSAGAGNVAASQDQRIKDETSAIGALRAMNSAQASFRSACGQGFYAPGLVELGRPARPGGEGFLAPALATGAAVTTKAGYTFRMASSESPVATPKEACNGVPLVRGYYVTATPSPGSGYRHFSTNTTGIIYNGDTPLKVTDQSSEGTPIK